MPAEIVVGTSSWADPGFVREWYPRGLAPGERLPWYAERFSAVEVNSTFYAVPAPDTVRRWAQVTPDHFSFDVKLHRLLSRHAAPVDSLPPDLRERARVGPRGRVLLDDRLQAELVDHILAAVAPLAEGGKLSSLLLQVSPAFTPAGHTLDELTALIARLKPHPVAVELRHRDWVAPPRVQETLERMAEHEAAWVCVDAPAGSSPTIMPAVDAVTRPGLAYMRAHGRNAEGYVKGRSVAERFAWRYSDAELVEMIGRARALAEQTGPDGQVRMMFNNNRGDDAPLAAQRTLELLAGRSALEPLGSLGARGGQLSLLPALPPPADQH